MQALYGFFQSDTDDLGKGEKELFKNIDKIYDLYINQLAFLLELPHVASVILEDAKGKHLATSANLNPNLKLVENKFLAQLAANIHLQREINNRKISWNNEFELVKRIYKEIKESEYYWKYMNVQDDSYSTHQNFILTAFIENIADYELLNHLYAEKNLHWGDDIFTVNPMVLKTINSFREHSTPDFKLLPLYKDSEDDVDFVKNLFRETILKNDEIEKLISEKTKNWEIDRIAMMDVLLMKMAICEAMCFSSIPLKVTLNEYIEISKTYSTPKSSIFINGVLDKIMADLNEDNKIPKMGRGLINKEKDSHSKDNFPKKKNNRK